VLHGVSRLVTTTAREKSQTSNPVFVVVVK
jgi:hypothetical protein